MEAAQQFGRSYSGGTGGAMMGAGQAGPTAVAPVTLASALSSVDSLNKRLSEITSMAHQIAMAVGGPFPCGDDANAVTPEPPSAVHMLNSRIDGAHRQVDHLNQCLQALGRSLGA